MLDLALQFWKVALRYHIRIQTLHVPWKRNITGKYIFFFSYEFYLN